MAGFLLGLSTGAACLAYCGPVLVPYLLGRAEGCGRSYSALAQFLAGRFCGYLLFALAAWTFNLLILRAARSAPRAVISGAIYLCLAAALAFWSRRRPKALCAGGKLGPRLGDSRRTLFPVLLGFLTGLNLCSPFLLAFTGAAEAGSLRGSLLFFAAFFLGTSIYLVPLPLLGALGRREARRIVGRLAAAKQCPTFSLDEQSVKKGRTLLTCTKCGRCVDACPRGAAYYHVKGTALGVKAETARLLFLYPAFLFLAAVGGGMIAGGLWRLIKLLTTGSMI